MKKFFSAFILFCLPLIGGFCLIERKLTQLPNSYNQKKAGIESQLNDIEVLVTGSSHEIYGIDPGLFSYPSYNLANVSQTLYYDAKLVDHYSPKMTKLKVVVFPISYFTFFREMQDVQEDWRMYFYYYYWKIPVIGKSVFDLQKYSLFTIYSPYTVFGFMRRNFKLDPVPGISRFGYTWRDSIGHLQNVTEENGKLRVEFIEKAYRKKNIAITVQYLDDCIRKLRDKNIQVVFISTPVFHTFYENFNSGIVAENKKNIDFLCEKYKCKYYDYTKDDRFTIADFSDNDHMDFLGAAKFSKILDSEIIKPIVEKR